MNSPHHRPVTGHRARQRSIVDEQESRVKPESDLLDAVSSARDQVRTHRA